MNLFFSIFAIFASVQFSSAHWQSNFNLNNILKSNCRMVSPRVCKSISGFDPDFICGFILRHVCYGQNKQQMQQQILRDKDLHVTPLTRNMAYYDINNDGFISLKEFARTLGHKPHELHVNVAFFSADRNGDQLIDKQEFENNDVWVFEERKAKKAPRNNFGLHKVIFGADDSSESNSRSSETDQVTRKQIPVHRHSSESAEERDNKSHDHSHEHFNTQSYEHSHEHSHEQQIHDAHSRNPAEIDSGESFEHEEVDHGGISEFNSKDKDNSKSQESVLSDVNEFFDNEDASNEISNEDMISLPSNKKILVTGDKSDSIEDIRDMMNTDTSHNDDRSNENLSYQRSQESFSAETNQEMSKSQISKDESSSKEIINSADNQSHENTRENSNEHSNEITDKISQSIETSLEKDDSEEEIDSGSEELGTDMSMKQGNTKNYIIPPDTGNNVSSFPLNVVKRVVKAMSGAR